MSRSQRAVPQTPLAHLNLLAKSRGTPNAYVAGVYEDPVLEEWDWYNVPVVFQVTEDSVLFTDITTSEYKTWLGKQGTPSFEIDQVDLAQVPYWIELVEGGFEAPLPKWQRPWPRVLPTRPVPLGFAVDTLLYALVLGLLVAGAVRLVRRVRRLQ